MKNSLKKTKTYSTDFGKRKRNIRTICIIDHKLWVILLGIIYYGSIILIYTN